MKLPRAVSTSSVQMPRHQTNLLPRPAMVTRRNQRFIPQENPSLEFRVGMEKRETINMLTGGVVDAILRWQERTDKADLEQKKADYARYSTEQRTQIERYTPLEMDVEVPNEDGTTSIQTIDPAVGVSQRFQDEMDTYAENLLEGSSNNVKAAFNAWRSGADMKHSASLAEWEHERQIDAYDARMTRAINEATASGNEQKVKVLIADMRSTGAFKSTALAEKEDKALRQIYINRAAAGIATARIGMERIDNPEDVVAIQQSLLAEMLPLMERDPVKYGELAKTILALDEDANRNLDRRQSERASMIFAEINQGRSMGERAAIAQRYANREGIVAEIGHDKFVDLVEYSDTLNDKARKTNPAEQQRVEELIRHYERTGAGRLEAERALRASRELHPDTVGSLYDRINKAYANRTGKALKRLQGELDIYLDIYRESSTGGLFSRTNKRELTDDEAYEIQIVDRVLEEEVYRQAEAGTLREWIMSPDSAMFVREAYKKVTGASDTEEKNKFAYKPKGTDETEEVNNRSAVAKLAPHANLFHDFVQQYGSVEEAKIAWTRDPRGLPTVTGPDGTIFYPYTDDLKEIERYGGND